MIECMFNTFYNGISFQRCVYSMIIINHLLKQVIELEIWLYNLMLLFSVATIVIIHFQTIKLLTYFPLTSSRPHHKKDLNIILFCIANILNAKFIINTKNGYNYNERLNIVREMLLTKSSLII